MCNFSSENKIKLRSCLKIIFAHKGTDIILRARSHPSVGITSRVKHGNAFTVKDYIEYKNEDFIRDGNCGGDDGERIYHLTPQKRGIHMVLLKHSFRGEDVNTKRFLIIVI